MQILILNVKLTLVSTASAAFPQPWLITLQQCEKCPQSKGALKEPPTQAVKMLNHAGGDGVYVVLVTFTKHKCSVDGSKDLCTP